MVGVQGGQGVKSKVRDVTQCHGRYDGFGRNFCEVIYGTVVSLLVCDECVVKRILLWWV